MNHAERRQLERRADALEAWRGLERREAKRRAIVSARQAHWFERYMGVQSDD